MVSKGRVDGTQLYYEVAGEGRPLVLVHSGGFDRRIWEEQVSAFADHYKVICYDVRGHGQSALPTKPYSDSEDLASLLQWLQVENAHLVSLSMGGRILIDFALAHPEMIDCLILVAPDLSGYAFSGEHIQGWIKIVTSIEHEDGTPAGDLWLQSPYLLPAMENPAVARQLRPIARENARTWLIHPLLARDPFVVPSAAQRLSEIHAPTLLVVGDRDTSDVENMVRLLENGITGIQKVVISGAGHIVNMEKPTEFNRVVLEFLSNR